MDFRQLTKKSRHNKIIMFGTLPSSPLLLITERLLLIGRSPDSDSTSCYPFPAYASGLSKGLIFTVSGTYRTSTGFPILLIRHLLIFLFYSNTKFPLCQIYIICQIIINIFTFLNFHLLL